MPIVSIGDMSKHFISLKNSGEIKSDLARLGQELSSGRRSDVVSFLGGDTRQLLGIKHSISVVEGHLQTATETSMLLEHMQLALARVDDARSRTAETVLKINPQSQPLQIEQAAKTAKSAFSDIVSTLNGTYAGRSIFGGTQVDSPPLADPEAMLTDISASIAGFSTISDVVQAIDDWFDDPAGGFSTMGYLGDRGDHVARSIGSDQKLSIDVRADDKPMREILKATALAATLDSISGNFSTRDQGAILQMAGTKMLAASSDAVQMQSTIGYLQETVAVGQTRLASESISLGIAYNSLTSADPFETATKLEAVQMQLETHFTVTSRLSRLSLVEYI